MTRKKSKSPGDGDQARRKPTARQIARYGEIVFTHTFGRSIWHECDSGHKWRGLYATNIEDEIDGPFDHLPEALFDVTSGSTEINCTELSAEELAARLQWECMEDGFDLSLNGEPWVFQDGAFRQAERGQGDISTT